ncbi:PREDICTED: uncharacterized protein LOC101293327 [Fragaria vesca subsp. vesca]|uniref:uncharacterized protein LOC101293327 n=1 Tax=Fragaria vesca subsp. vesca TaxID=101020 RepID=UPI0002C2EF25|nr:PREDICTED: uncharacterized protein LOC101293327 [Fragaria vesca subsp. vesca]
MKREGRQHGMVRTYRVLPATLNPRAETRHVNKFDSLPTAGLFTKVSTRPNNHSKYTSKCTKPKCTECRIHPASKSKDKTKGNQKLKSSDVVTNHRLVTWRVVDGRSGLNFSGLSATGILDNLSSGYYDTHDGDEDEKNEIDDVDENGSIGSEEVMSCCNVDNVFDYQIEEDEGWCLVPQT